MKKNIIKTLSLILIGIMILSGCSSKTSSEVIELKTALEEQKTINQNLQAEVQRLTREIDELKAENQGLVDQIREADGAMISLYTANVDTLAKEEIGKIDVKVDKQGKIQDMEKLLNSLGDELSKRVFEGLPIDIEEIKVIDGKKVAIINLKEDDNLNVGWASNFFQGSTGAAITDISLQETFLQKEYTGEWIDGIQILYEGEAPEFDHLPTLGQIVYR